TGDGVHQTLKLTYTGLFGITTNHSGQNLIRYSHRIVFQTVRFDSFRKEILLRDLHLLIRRVPGDVDDLHTVTQWPRDGTKVVSGHDEHHLREVVFGFDVVVSEVFVLRRVEHLEHRCPWIAAEVRTHLVDLIQEDDRVRSSGFFKSVDDLTWH